MATPQTPLSQETNVDLTTIIKSNNITRDRLRELVNRLTDIDLTRDLGENWTVASTLAHCALFDFRVAALFDRWKRTGEVTAVDPDSDMLNVALLPFFLALPPRTAALMALDAAEAADSRIAELELDMDLLEKIEAAGEDLPVTFNRGEHRKEHIRQIEGALVSMSSAPKKPSVRVKSSQK